MSYLSPFMREYKFAWPWLWPLEWAKVKCKYTVRTPISDFLHIGNSNSCSSFTVWKITTFNLLKWSWFESLILKKNVKVMNSNIAKYVVGWRLCDLQVCWKIVNLSQTVFLWSTNVKYTHTYTHTHTRDDDSYRMHCIALHL